jgi:hypothetical protein
MKKSKDIYQCVEYNYIENYKNGFIFDNINDAAELICNIKSEELSNIKLYCKECVNKKLTIEKMVKKFYDGINTIN